MKRIIYGSLSVLTAVCTVFVSAKAEVFNAKNEAATVQETAQKVPTKEALSEAGSLFELAEEDFSKGSLANIKLPSAPITGAAVRPQIRPKADPRLEAQLTEDEMIQEAPLESTPVVPATPGTPSKPDMTPPAGSPELEEPGNITPVSPNEPGLDDPALNDPALDDPALDEPGLNQPELDEPGLDDPTLEDPALDQPGLSDPVLDDPALDDSPASEDLPPIPESPAPGFPPAGVPEDSTFPAEPVEPPIEPVEPLPPSDIEPLPSDDNFEDGLDDSAVPDNDFPVGDTGSGDRLVGEGFTAFQLSYLALGGGLKEQGIPGGSLLVSAYKQGDISAEDVVEAGAVANRLGTNANDQDDYTKSVDRFLKIIRRDARTN